VRVTQDVDDAALEGAVGDTVFGLARGEDGTFTVIRYLLQIRDAPNHG
jgi:hypothetical protein